jgi:hypothetical protein
MTWGRKPNATEVVVVRMSNPQSVWSTDYWLSICALIMESGAERDVVLHLRRGFSIPEEFEPLTIVNDNDPVKRAYPFFINGFNHGDILMAYLLLHVLPPYAFLWSIEDDCRINGRWSEDIYDFRNPQADLIVWKGKDETFSRDKWWHQPQYNHGAWATKPPSMVGSWTMAFGMSVQLARQLLKNIKEGTFVDHQEVNLITTANEAPHLTIVYGNVKREWECCDLGNAQAMYDHWVSCLETPLLMHPVKKP